jgi:hypothetical protein
LAKWQGVALVSVSTGRQGVRATFSGGYVGQVTCGAIAGSVGVYFFEEDR